MEYKFHELEFLFHYELHSFVVTIELFKAL